MVLEVLKSGEKSWGEYGGGGWTTTPKNHFYSFEVTEDNSFVDIVLESKNTEVALYIADTNGQIIDYDETERRKLFLIAKLNKGTYHIMAATSRRGTRGSYNLSVTGKTKNLAKRDVNEKVIEGNIANNKDVKEYIFEITENNSLIDLEFNSLNVEISLYLYESSGKLIERTYSYEYSGGFIAKVQKGTYKVYISPPNFGSPSGNFKLVTVGNFK